MMETTTIDNAVDDLKNKFNRIKQYGLNPVYGTKGDSVDNRRTLPTSRYNAVMNQYGIAKMGNGMYVRT